MMANNLLCIYHGNCADGFGAAWVVRKKFGDKVDFHAGVHQNQPPDVTGKHVIFVDFSYKRAVLLEMATKAKSITILDHHKSAADDLTGFPEPETITSWINDEPPTTHITTLFDMNRSGAMMAWNYFFPEDEAPLLISHIQDRDLWLFRMNGTREIQANVFSYPYDFKIWDDLMEMDVRFLRNEGAAIERKHHKDIAELLGVTKRRMIIGGHSVPVANLPYTLASDAGHILGVNEPFAATYYDTPEGRVFSLRSAEDGLDVSDIAKIYDGGGHPHAAGFRVEIGWEGETPMHA